MAVLLEALADCPVFCPHLHLPLQSGDDEILALMRRGYDGDAFARVCDAARARLGDDLHISSDILVGFPGEGETAFQNTLSLMRKVGLGLRRSKMAFKSIFGDKSVSLTSFRSARIRPK